MHDIQRAAARPPRRSPGQPEKQGLYDPWFEHEACGVGFVVDVKGRKSHRILQQAIQVLRNLDHRGACGCEANTGDGAGVLVQMPHAVPPAEAAKKDAYARCPKPGQLRLRPGVPAAQSDQAPQTRPRSVRATSCNPWA